MVTKTLHRPKVRETGPEFSKIRRLLQLFVLGAATVCLLAFLFYTLYPRTRTTYLATVAISDYGDDSIFINSVFSDWNTSKINEQLEKGNWSKWTPTQPGDWQRSYKKSLGNDKFDPIDSKEDFLNIWNQRLPPNPDILGGSNDVLVVQMRCQSLADVDRGTVDLIVLKSTDSQGTVPLADILKSLSSTRYKKIKNIVLFADMADIHFDLNDQQTRLSNPIVETLLEDFQSDDFKEQVIVPLTKSGRNIYLLLPRADNQPTLLTRSGQTLFQESLERALSAGDPSSKQLNLADLYQQLFIRMSDASDDSQFPILLSVVEQTWIPPIAPSSAINDAKAKSSFERAQQVVLSNPLPKKNNPKPKESTSDESKSDSVKSDEPRLAQNTDSQDPKDPNASNPMDQLEKFRKEIRYLEDLDVRRKWLKFAYDQRFEENTPLPDEPKTLDPQKKDQANRQAWYVPNDELRKYLSPSEAIDWIDHRESIQSTMRAICELAEQLRLLLDLKNGISGLDEESNSYKDLKKDVQTIEKAIKQQFDVLSEILEAIDKFRSDAASTSKKPWWTVLKNQKVSLNDFPKACDGLVETIKKFKNGKNWNSVYETTCLKLLGSTQISSQSRMQLRELIKEANRPDFRENRPEMSPDDQDYSKLKESIYSNDSDSSANEILDGFRKLCEKLERIAPNNPKNKSNSDPDTQAIEQWCYWIRSALSPRSNSSAQAHALFPLGNQAIQLRITSGLSRQNVLDFEFDPLKDKKNTSKDLVLRTIHRDPNVKAKNSQYRLRWSSGDQKQHQNPLDISFQDKEFKKGDLKPISMDEDHKIHMELKNDRMLCSVPYSLNFELIDEANQIVASEELKVYANVNHLVLQATHPLQGLAKKAPKQGALGMTTVDLPSLALGSYENKYKLKLINLDNKERLASVKLYEIPKEYQLTDKSRFKNQLSAGKLDKFLKAQAEPVNLMPETSQLLSFQPPANPTKPDDSSDASGQEQVHVFVSPVFLVQEWPKKPQTSEQQDPSDKQTESKPLLSEVYFSEFQRIPQHSWDLLQCSTLNVNDQDDKWILKIEAKETAITNLVKKGLVEKLQLKLSKEAGVLPAEPINLTLEPTRDSTESGVEFQIPPLRSSLYDDFKDILSMGTLVLDLPNEPRSHFFRFNKSNNTWEVIKNYSGGLSNLQRLRFCGIAITEDGSPYRLNQLPKSKEDRIFFRTHRSESKGDPALIPKFLQITDLQIDLSPEDTMFIELIQKDKKKQIPIKEDRINRLQGGVTITEDKSLAMKFFAEDLTEYIELPQQDQPQQGLIEIQVGFRVQNNQTINKTLVFDYEKPTLLLQNGRPVIFKEKTGKEEEKTFDLVLACTDSNGSGISKGLLWVLESNGKRSKEAIKGTYQRRDEKDFIHFPIDENKVGEFSDFDLEIEDNAGNVIKEKLKVPAE